MSRWSIALVALATVTACKEPKGVQVDGRELIPLEATVAFGFEVGPLRASPIGSALYPLLQGDGDMRGMVEAVQGCNLALDELRCLMAIDPANENRFFAYVEGSKIGETDTVRCIEKGFAKATGGKDGRLVFQTRGDVQTLDQEGGGKLIILNKNALVVVDEHWQEQTFTAIEKPESRNKTGVLATTVATIDPSTDTWFAIMFGDEERASWSGLAGGDGIAAVSMVADLAQGAKIAASIDGRDAANAKEIEGSLRGALGELKPGLAAMGLPENLLDGLKLSSADARVTATVEIGSDALPGVVTAVMAAAMGE